MTAIYVDEGQKVTRGELVLQIDDQRLRAAVDQQQASVRMQEIAIQRQQLQVENLRTQWNRMQGLHERKLIDEDSFVTSSNNLEIAEVDLMSSRESLEQARAQLEQQEDRLSKTRVYLADRRHRHDARHQGRRDGDLELDEHSGLEPDDDRESREHPHRGQRRRSGHRERRRSARARASTRSRIPTSPSTASSIRSPCRRRWPKGSRARASRSRSACSIPRRSRCAPA